MSLDEALKKVKHADKILTFLGNGPALFNEIWRTLSIGDRQSIERSLVKLRKLGLVDKTQSGLWRRVDNEENVAKQEE